MFWRSFSITELLHVLEVFLHHWTCYITELLHVLEVFLHHWTCSCHIHFKQFVHFPLFLFLFLLFSFSLALELTIQAKLASDSGYSNLPSAPSIGVSYQAQLMHSSQRACCSLTLQTVLNTFYIRGPQDHHYFRDFLKRFHQHNVYLVAKISCNNTVRIQDWDQLQWHNGDTELRLVAQPWDMRRKKTESGGICLYMCFLVLSLPWQETEITLFT